MNLLVVAVGSTAPDRGAYLWHGGEGQPGGPGPGPLQRRLPVLHPAHLGATAVPGRLLRPGHGGHRRAQGRRSAAPLPGTRLTGWLNAVIPIR